MSSESTTLTIPMPSVAPTGWEIDTADMVHGVWDMVMAERAGRIQSIEDRMLMSILRATHEGLHRMEPCGKCEVPL